MPLYLFSVLLLVFVSLALYGKYKGSKKHLYIFKPLATITVIASAFYFSLPGLSKYESLILLGLFFCLAGDVFLMFKRQFIYGLLSFLAAHLLFLYAFSSLNKTFTWELAAIAILLGLYVYLKLSPYLGNKKIPVAFYIVVILAMARSAVENIYYYYNPGVFLISVGAALFVISDIILAFDRFRKPFRYSHLFVYLTYYAAIFMFARSAAFIM